MVSFNFDLLPQGFNVNLPAYYSHLILYLEIILEAKSRIGNSLVKLQTIIINEFPPLFAIFYH